MKKLLMLLVALFACMASFGQEVKGDRNSKENKALFTKTLREAARSQEAAMRVANMYYEGVGTDINRFDAFDWYKKALSVLDNESNYRLAMLYFDGEVTPLNPKRAYELLKPLIISGYAPAVAVAPRVEGVVAEQIDVKLQNAGATRLSDSEFHKVARTVKEVWPTFIGGRKAMDEYIASQTSYPEEAIKRKVRGEVIIRAMIDAEGKVTKVKVVKQLDTNLEFVAARAIRNMPKWNPGYVEREYQGEIRRQYLPYAQVFPIVFQLPEMPEK